MKRVCSTFRTSSGRRRRRRRRRLAAAQPARRQMRIFASKIETKQIMSAAPKKSYLLNNNLIINQSSIIDPITLNLQIVPRPVVLHFARCADGARLLGGRRRNVERRRYRHRRRRRAALVRCVRVSQSVGVFVACMRGDSEGSTGSGEENVVKRSVNTANDKNV